MHLRRVCFMAYYLLKIYFSCQIRLFVTAKSDQDPDPNTHESALVWLPGSGSALKRVLLRMHICLHNEFLTIQESPYISVLPR
jgi:hypothetical protein